MEALTELAVGWLRGASGFNTWHIKQAGGVASWLGASRRGPGQGRSISPRAGHVPSFPCVISVHHRGGLGGPCYQSLWTARKLKHTERR